MNAGDKVIDRLTGNSGTVVRVFTRDDVELVEVSVGNGETTTATPDWFMKA